MKKTYNKPQIIFESFEFTTSIAAGCQFLTDTKSDANSCVYTENGNTIFLDACGFDEETLEILCYHVPTEDYIIFNS